MSATTPSKEIYIPQKRPIFSQKSPISYVLPKGIVRIIHDGMSTAKCSKETYVSSKEPYV